MNEAFDIQAYMTHGVERVIADSLKATAKNPKETAFLLKFASASKKASKKRSKAFENGEHIPPFLIASITSSCNLHCAGCYSRHNEATVDIEPVNQLSGDDWKRIFMEADDMGISFILLAGGEPLVRRDVIEEALNFKNIIFPVFTNGTFIGDNYIKMFDDHRNLIPVISIEGNQYATDSRRGIGVYSKLITAMDNLSDKNIMFGASITVTTENLDEVTSDAFLKTLSDRGCKLIIYVEYVPVSEEDDELALNEEEREYLTSEISRIRSTDDSMVFVSFPGDEKGSDGCIAAGRGFFHINSHGGAEPCPFSPYSDVNVKDLSLREALNSKLFKTLRDNDILKDDHQGGCVLFEKRDLVEAALLSLD